ncbi:hypothetical protein IGK23_000625 [Enterococcus sp. DIV1368c]
MNDETMKKIDQVTNEVSEKITNEQLTETRDEATGKPVNEQPKERAKEPIEEPVKELDADAGVDATEEPIEKPIEEPIQPTSHTKKATRDEPRVGLADSEFQRGNQEVPEEIKKWNWGAFSLNIIWGIGNKTYLPLLCLIPLFNFVWVFICGFKGNEGAWRDGNYTDVETFKQVQKTWSRAGIAMFIIQIVIILLYLVFVVFILSSLWYIRDSFIRDSYNYDPYIYDGYYY